MPLGVYRRLQRPKWYSAEVQSQIKVHSFRPRVLKSKFSVLLVMLSTVMICHLFCSQSRLLLYAGPLVSSRHLRPSLRDILADRCVSVAQKAVIQEVLQALIPKLFIRNETACEVDRHWEYVCSVD